MEHRKELNPDTTSHLLIALQEVVKKEHCADCREQGREVLAWLGAFDWVDSTVAIVVDDGADSPADEPRGDA